ncbi:MAG: helix-turn-helix transcriptional regulator [Deltaproteobacteria bacterium]|nr:helix-turn-helix transcriptional regulator [Deltaproteobacteria bacterium]
MAESGKMTRSTKRLKDIGLRLKEVRGHKNLSGVEMARNLYLSRSILSTFESGRKIPSGPVLLLLETLFMVDKHWLLTGEGDMFLKEKSPPAGNTPSSSDENIVGLIALIDGYRNLSIGGREKLFRTLQAFLLLEKNDLQKPTS